MWADYIMTDKNGLNEFLRKWLIIRFKKKYLAACA